MTLAVHIAALVPLAAVLALATITTAAVVIGWSPKIVTSGSMAPLLQPGDIVLAAPAQGLELEPGQVVVFDAPVGQVTHRLVTRRPDGAWVTRGDANAGLDLRAVPARDVTGVVRLVVPRLGLPSLWIRNGEGWALLVWASLLVTSSWGAVATYPAARRLLRGARTRGRGGRGVATRAAPGWAYPPPAGPNRPQEPPERPFHG